MSTNHPITWGEMDPKKRGPIIGTTQADQWEHRNVIGTHRGAYAGVFKGIAVAQERLDTNHQADLEYTHPIVPIGPHPSWARVAFLDPHGANVAIDHADLREEGIDVEPSIAVTRAVLNMPHIKTAIKEGKIKPDGKILKEDGSLEVVKAAVDPVWHLPSVAERLGVDEQALRQAIYQQSGGLFEALLTNANREVLLPPIGGSTVYIIGDPEKLGQPDTEYTVRIHDSCSGSDVFHSDVCTCRAYMDFALEECTKAAQKGGIGIFIYNQAEGRSMGEVTKYLIYNKRKTHPAGDRADRYFDAAEEVTGTTDMRIHEPVVDILHWLGITKIQNLISMSRWKIQAILEGDIEVVNRVALPEEHVSTDAHVEITAKIANDGYYAPEGREVSATELRKVNGRSYLGA